MKYLLDKKKLIIVGLMSGTSANGVDACIVEIRKRSEKFELTQIGFKTYKFTPFIQKKILMVSDPGYQNIDEIIRLDFLLGEYFANATKKIVKSCGLDVKDIDLIGSHGQTVRHLPLVKKMGSFNIRGTLQIGEPSVISARTGIITLADFRRKDIALGGEGAPLSPLAHFHLFNHEKKNQAVLNIGGISNLTFLPRGRNQKKVWGMDAGPGNILMDNLARNYFQKDFDKNGRIAFRGKVIQPVLERWLKRICSLLKKKKSLGREDLGFKSTRNFVEEVRKYSSIPEDFVTTASEFTVRSIRATFDNYFDPYIKIEELILCGGGALNRYLYSRLKEIFYPTRICLSEEIGYDPLAVESISFALFAFLTISKLQRGINDSGEARGNRILGKICIP